MNFLQKSHPEIIGANARVSLEGIPNLPAKIDTGADTSSVHVTHINVDKSGVLTFDLFGKKMSTTDFKAAIVRSSNGNEQIRYRTKLSLEIGGKKIRATFSLSDRSRNNFPILIGKRTIRGKFIVDVSRSEIEFEKNARMPSLNKKLRENPYKFHQQFLKSKKET